MYPLDAHEGETVVSENNVGQWAWKPATDLSDSGSELIEEVCKLSIEVERLCKVLPDLLMLAEGHIQALKGLFSLLEHRIALASRHEALICVLRVQTTLIRLER